MTISSTNRKAGPYSGNDSAAVFPFAFKVFSASDVLVVRANSTGGETTLVLNTDYTVALNADQDASPGGAVTLSAALAAGYTLVVSSSLQNLQPTDLTNQGGFYPRVISNALDRLTILIQQLAESVSRSLKTSITTPAGVNPTLPSPVPYQVIGWNGTGTGFQNTDPTYSTALATDLGNAADFLKGVALVKGAGRVVSSIAALRALPKNGSPNACVTGYYTAGDGGGGIYYYDSTDTTSADNGGTIIVAADGGRWKLAQRGDVSVKQFGAKGDGLTIDTAAIQAAATYYGALIGGDTSAAAGYVGDTRPRLLFDAGTYLCGKVSFPSRISIRAEGRVVIRSLTGASATPSGYWSDDVVVDGEIEGLTFLYFDTALRWQTGNADMSRHVLKRVTVASCNQLLDQVSYAASRSTKLTMENIKCSYAVPRLATIYADEATIRDSWLNHSNDSYLIWADSNLVFENNIVVPTGTAKTSRAVIWWQASDSARSLLCDGIRFGGEAGQSAIVVIGNVNGGNTNNSYRNQGVTFRRCEMSSNSSYDPDTIGAVNANVILRPSVNATQSIQFIKFEDCYAGPDKSGGVVQYYGSADVTTLLPSDFVIDMDASSLRSFVRGINKPTSAALERYVTYSQVNSKVSGIRGETGRIIPVATATAGQKKVSFKVDLSYPSVRHPPMAFLVTLTGQGTSANDSLAYACTSVYILTISGMYDTSVKSKIAYTKLHGSAMGISEAANADIVSAHWGTADTGSNLRALVGTAGANDSIDVTIAYGTGIGQLAACYIRPLFDFSLLT